MSKTFRIGVLGLSHDHVWDNLQELRASGQAVLVAAAEGHEPLRERVRQEYGCTVYADSQSLLERETLDAVYLYGDNRGKVEAGIRAAAKGLHLLVEKPLAADLADADRLLAAVRRAGVRLMVNWPFAWWPQLQQALRMAQAGEIGTLWQVRYRAAHEGPREMGCSPYFSDWLLDPQRNGGGALIDYCCYGAALARLLLGVPSRVMGIVGRLCKEDMPAEDNAVLVLSYPRALALTEASWTQIGKLTAYQPAIYGTRGTLLVEPRLGGRLWLATAAQPDGVEVALAKPAPEQQSASACFLHALATGQPFPELCQDRHGRDAQEILEAGLRSARSGQDVSLPLREGRP